MTQEDVSERLGITRQTMTNWDNGKSYPDSEQIIQLSDIYGLSLDELLKGDATMVHYLRGNTNVNRYLKLFAV